MFRGIRLIELPPVHAQSSDGMVQRESMNVLPKFVSKAALQCTMSKCFSTTHSTAQIRVDRLKSFVMTALLVEGLQAGDDRVKAGEPFVELVIELSFRHRFTASRISSELGVEIFAVGTGLHRDLLI